MEVCKVWLNLFLHIFRMQLFVFILLLYIQYYSGFVTFIAFRPSCLILFLFIFYLVNFGHCLCIFLYSRPVFTDCIYIIQYWDFPIVELIVIWKHLFKENSQHVDDDGMFSSLCWESSNNFLLAFSFYCMHEVC